MGAAGVTDGASRRGPQPDWCLLGPVRLVVDGTELDLGPAKQRSVLAILLMTPGRTVPTETLIDRVWGERPPRSPNPAAPYVTRLRKILAGAGLGSVRYAAGGYRLDADPDRVDLHRARRLAGEARVARAAGDDALAADLLGAALAGWSPAPLAGVPGEWADRTRAALAREGLDLHARRAEANLRLGRHAAVVEDLRPLVAEQPGAENLAAALMLALAGSGRPAEALECYARVRATAHKLGTEPARQLADLQLRILRNDPDLAGGTATATAAGNGPGPDAGPDRDAPTGQLPGRPETRPVPAELPADVAAFTGRHAELARLDSLLPERTERPDAPAQTAIAAVSGTAGVGKTALAVRWAHRVCARFPDGQLYVNLRGYDPELPVTAGAALARLLRSLGVADTDIPPDVDERAARYRSELAGRKVLVLLDNAGTADQVRPLLPGSPGCAVLVTSRDSLAGLVAVDGAGRLDLDLLPLPDARSLLGTLIGDRAAIEPTAADALAQRCARLPLALRVAAELAVGRPAASLAELVAELSDQRQRLELLDSGEDPRAAVTAVFSWSVQQLPAAAAGLFRLLGLHPGPDISAAAAASLAGRPLPEVRSSLTRLARAHLIVEHPPARFSFHDLLRAYASQLAHTLDTADRQRGAVRRIVDHYLGTAHAAARLVDPARDPITLPAPQPGVVAEQLGDQEQALAWMSSELPVLRGVAQLAADAGLHRAAWQLAWALDDILDRRADWPDRAANAQAGLAAAHRLDDPAAQAHAHRLVALAYTRLDRHGDARDHLQHALTLSSAAGDVVGQAHIHLSLALALERADDNADALRHAQRSLRLYQTGGHRIGQANALNEVGWLYALLGDHQQALDACRPALALLQELGDRSGQAGAWDSLGYVYDQLGDHATAIPCYQRSIDLYRDLGERYNEADTLRSLGAVYEAAGHRQHARRAWQRALTILDQLDHPDAEHVRVSLGRTDQIPVLGR